MLNYAELRKFLAQDKLAKLVEALHAATARLDTDLNNQVVTIAGRLTRVSTQLNTGQISHVEANQERSRISAALLDIINQLEADYPATRQPTGYQQQQRVRQTAPPRQQSRPVWPYVLLGVVVCIVVLGIIGNMMQSGEISNLGASTALQEPTSQSTPTQPSNKQPSGGTQKFTDQRPDPSTPASTGYSAADLVGAWEFSAAESGVQMLVHIQLNNDRSFQSQAYLNGAAFSSDAGTWNLVGSMFHQTSSSTGTEISRLSWISRNQFRLTNPEEGISIILSRLE